MSAAGGAVLGMVGGQGVRLAHLGAQVLVECPDTGECLGTLYTGDALTPARLARQAQVVAFLSRTRRARRGGR